MVTTHSLVRSGWRLWNTWGIARSASTGSRAPCDTRQTLPIRHSRMWQRGGREAPRREANSPLVLVSVSLTALLCEWWILRECVKQTRQEARSCEARRTNNRDRNARLNGLGPNGWGPWRPRGHWRQPATSCRGAVLSDARNRQPVGSGCRLAAQRLPSNDWRFHPLRTDELWISATA